MPQRGLGQASLYSLTREHRPTMTKAEALIDAIEKRRLRNVRRKDGEFPVGFVEVDEVFSFAEREPRRQPDRQTIAWNLIGRCHHLKKITRERVRGA